MIQMHLQEQSHNSSGLPDMKKKNWPKYLQKLATSKLENGHKLANSMLHFALNLSFFKSVLLHFS